MDALIGVNMAFIRVNADKLVTEMIMRDQPKDEFGRFVSPYDEPLSKKVVGVRLPQSIYERLLQLAEEQSKSPGEVLRELVVTVLTQDRSQPEEVSEDSLEKTRDSVLSRLRLGKQSQGAKAINQFIKELRE